MLKGLYHAKCFDSKPSGKTPQERGGAKYVSAKLCTNLESVTKSYVKTTQLLPLHNADTLSALKKSQLVYDGWFGAAVCRSYNTLNNSSNNY